ncbi:MAG: 3'-5' exonuclease, partial [Candidatus Eisenbacteria bacterium]
QSRALEIALRHAGIRYQIVGSTSFYEKREVKDILAYLRLCANPRDEASLRRILNVPPRRIGPSAVAALEELASKRGVSIFEALRIFEREGEAADSTRRGIKQLLSVIDEFSLRQNEVVENIIGGIVERVCYIDYLRKEAMGVEERMENLDELLASARGFSENWVDPGDCPEAGEEADSGFSAQSVPPLNAFLNDVSLVAQIDAWQPDEETVTLMTAHNAKGLEFTCVIITGLEDGLFPHAASMDSEEELEEERRLFYVALTRAKQRVILTAAGQRRRFDFRGELGLSRFVREIPERLVEMGRVRDGRRVETRVETMVGKEVLHREFGRGRIVAQEGSGDKAKLTVEFGGAVRRKVFARYAEVLEN